MTAVWVGGDFTVGNLLIKNGAEVEVLVNGSRLVIFDAKKVHKVQDYSGEQFVIVLYQSPFRHDVDKNLTARLKAAGFVTEEARAWSLPRRVALDPEQVQKGEVLYAGRGSDRLGLAPSI